MDNVKAKILIKMYKMINPKKRPYVRRNLIEYKKHEPYKLVKLPSS